MFAENLIHIGKVAKLHGFDGEALLFSGTDFPKKINKTEWVFLLIDGLPVPFYISSIMPRNDTSAIIKFADINSAEEMEEYVGFDVFIEVAKKRKTKTYSYNEDIVGFKVIDKKHGSIGIVKAVINYLDNYLLQVINGNHETLVPYNDNLILKVDSKAKSIVVTLPDGLIELNK
jgi:16S rRNA processing protein RimM